MDRKMIIVIADLNILFFMFHKYIFVFFDFNSAESDLAYEITFKTDEKMLNLKIGYDFVPDLKSCSKQIKSEIVFVGFGRTDNGYNDLEGINIKNKTILYYNSPPKYFSKEQKKQWSRGFSKTNFYKRIIDNNALGIISITPVHDRVRIVSAYKKNYFSQWNKQKSLPIIKLSNELFYELLEMNNIDTNKFTNLINDLNKNINFEISNCSVDFNINVEYQYKKVDNIYSFIRGKDTSQTVIIGAHYDHLPPKSYKENRDSIRNGADDNASGVSLLLELSKNYSLSRSIPECNIAFIYFNAEESHFMGSKYFIENLPLDFGLIKAMINLDMVGRLKQDSLFIDYFSSSLDWIDIIESIPNESLKLNFIDRKISTDNFYFYKEKIPTILFTTGLHEDLHKPSDEFNKINLNGMVDIFKVVKQTIDATVKYDSLTFNLDY